VRNGRLSPVFFGSALTNFGVEPFLEEFLRMTMPPCREAGAASSTLRPRFSAFVFKIQANMNKAHRDRMAFMRICSGKFQRDNEYYHVQGNKKMRLAQPQQLMAQSARSSTRPTPGTSSACSTRASSPSATPYAGAECS
jgi:peptide chain release factor 3